MSTDAIDGKTMRGSENGQHNAYHVVSAWVAENQITLGRKKNSLLHIGYYLPKELSLVKQVDVGKEFSTRRKSPCVYGQLES